MTGYFQASSRPSLHSQDCHSEASAGSRPWQLVSSVTAVLLSKARWSAHCGLPHSPTQAFKAAIAHTRGRLLRYLTRMSITHN